MKSGLRKGPTDELVFTSTCLPQIDISTILIPETANPYQAALLPCRYK